MADRPPATPPSEPQAGPPAVEAPPPTGLDRDVPLRWRVVYLVAVVLLCLGIAAVHFRVREPGPRPDFSVALLAAIPSPAFYLHPRPAGGATKAGLVAGLFNVILPLWAFVLGTHTGTWRQGLSHLGGIAVVSACCTILNLMLLVGAA